MRVQSVAGQGAAKFLQGGVGICCISGKRKRAHQMCLVEPNRGSFRNRFSKPDNCLVVVSHREIRAAQHPIKYTDSGITRTESYRLQRQWRRFFGTSRQDELIGLLRVAEGKIGIERERPVKSVQGPLMISLCATNEAIIHMVHEQASDQELNAFCSASSACFSRSCACVGILLGLVPAIPIVTHQDISQLAPGVGRQRTEPYRFLKILACGKIVLWGDGFNRE